jgi:hypothetical protein
LWRVRSPIVTDADTDAVAGDWHAADRVLPVFEGHRLVGMLPERKQPIAIDLLPPEPGESGRKQFRRSKEQVWRSEEIVSRRRFKALVPRNGFERVDTPLVGGSDRSRVRA